VTNSKVAEFHAWLENGLDTCDFTRPGIDQALGRDLVNKSMKRITE